MQEDQTTNTTAPKSPQSDILRLAPGTVLAEKFEVIGELSQNGGHSYLCRRLTAPYRGDLARVKLFAPNKLGEDDQTAAARFQHEVVATISVRDPNVVRVDQTITVQNYLGFVAEFLAGRTLEDHLEEHPILEIKQLVTFLRQMCSGTEAIHRAGIIHRSLKPRNILVTDQGHIKIIDFGLAKIVGQRNLTRAGVRIGTIDYMSPEYLIDNVCTPMTDIYALGVIGYRMVTGELPLWADDPLETMSLRLQSDAVPPHLINSACPLELSHIIMKALHRNPEARYQRAIELQRDLERLPGLGTNSLPVAPSPGTRARLSSIFQVENQENAGKRSWLGRLFGK